MSDTKVVTGPGIRFSYANVFEPKAMDENSEPKYSVTLLIPKKDKVTVEKIKRAIKAAELEGKSKTFGGKIPKVYRYPALRDGDEEKPDNEEYEGCYFVNAKSSTKPGLVDEDVNEIITRDEFYSGCYGRASINFYAYNKGGNKGIGCGLNNLQKLEDGENLGGGGATAAEDFGTGEDDLM